MGLWHALYQAGYCYIKKVKGKDPDSLSENELRAIFAEAYKEAKEKVNKKRKKQGKKEKNSLAIFGSRGRPEKKIKEAFENARSKKSKGKGLFCEICGRQPAYEIDFLWGKSDLLSSTESAFRVCSHHMAIIYIGAVFAIGDAEFIEIFRSGSDSYAWFAVPEVIGEGDICRKWMNSFHIKDEGISAPSEEQMDANTELLFRRLVPNIEAEDGQDAYVVWIIGVMRYSQNARAVYALIPGVDTHYIRKLNEIGGGENLRVLSDWRNLIKNYQRIAFSDSKGDWWVRMYIDTSLSLLSRSFLSIPLISMVGEDVVWNVFKRTVLREKMGKNEYSSKDVYGLWNFIRFVSAYYRQILHVDEKSWNRLMSLYFLGRAMGHYDSTAVNRDRPPKFGLLMLSYRQGVDRLIEDVLLGKLSAMMLSGEDVRNIVMALAAVNLDIDDEYRSLMGTFLWMGYLRGREKGIPKEFGEIKVSRMTYKGYILGKLLRGKGDIPLSVSREVMQKLSYSKEIDHGDILRWLIKASHSCDIMEFISLLKEVGYVSEDVLRNRRFLAGMMLGLMGVEGVSPYGDGEAEKFKYPLGSLSAKVGYIWGRRVKEGLPMASFRHGVVLLLGQKSLSEVIGSMQMQYYIGRIFGEDELWRIKNLSEDKDLNVRDIYGGFVRAVVGDE